METGVDNFVVHNTFDVAKAPTTTIKEKIELAVNPKVKEIREKINESEENGVDRDTGDTVFSILNTTKKVVDLCMEHPRLSKDFSMKFNIEDGVVSRKSEAGFIVAKDPVQMANNFAEISDDNNIDRVDIANWMVESSLTNLATWVGLAAEANPIILREINDDLDISKFGLSAEVIIKDKREKIIVPDDGKIPETLFSEKLKSISQEITDKYGDKVAGSILLCGGSARSWIMQEDPLDNPMGDIDYAVVTEIPEETRKGINEIFAKHASGKPDDLTDPDLPFSQNMQKEGFKDIYDAIKKDPTYSIDKIAINITTGEIFDPYGGLQDFKNGILRIVGENYKTGLRGGWDNSKEALILAFRGARFGAQYGMEIDPDTATFFKSVMEKNKLMNRFHLAYRGIDELPYFSEVGKTYLKMLEKTSSAVLIPKHLEKFGLLKQVSRAINNINFGARLMWGYELKTIDELIWDKNYRQLAEQSMADYPQEGEDIRFTGKGREEEEFRQKAGPIKFITSTLAISRMLGYLLTGL